MATPRAGTPYLAGPVPFDDVVDGGEDDIVAVPPPPADEYADVVSAMPSATIVGFPVHRYQDTWVLEQWVTGVLAPRPDDVLLASLPKCGTTWLKSLAFSVMAREAYPPSAADHPLLRLNPHQCVPLLEDLFSSSGEAAAKAVEALPSPRLMNTHMHHSLLPPSVTDDDKCKIVYLFEHACQGQTPNGPIWDNILGYWRASRAHPDKVLFLRYSTRRCFSTRAMPSLTSRASSGYHSRPPRRRRAPLPTLLSSAALRP
uniref:Uncharacterized protein n=1 Tax=Avena sativa TaxID=4498 RepID=A0ACD5ZRX2_AVESA